MVDEKAGQLGRVIPSGQIFVPGSITVRQEKLCWANNENSRVVTPEPSMLDAFVRLWSEPSSSIAKFARRWGVLHLDPKAYFSGEESLESWRRYSRNAEAVLKLAAAARQGNLGMIDDWRELLDHSYTHPSEPLVDPKTVPERFASFMFDPRKPLERAGQWIACDLQGWLNLWHVPPPKFAVPDRPRHTWVAGDSRPVVRLEGPDRTYPSHRAGVALRTFHKPQM